RPRHRLARAWRGRGVVEGVTGGIPGPSEARSRESVTSVLSNWPTPSHIACFVVMDSGLTPAACPGMTKRSKPMSVAEQHSGKPAISLKDADFNWEDPLDLESELTEEERMVRDTARSYAQEKL